jgi:Mrp family chromosome partitioning ATPase
MSRNFELMNQAGQNLEAAPIATSSPAIPKADEKVRTIRTRLSLGQVAHEEALGIVQRLFLQQSQNPPRVVAFAGIDQSNGCSEVSLRVAETLGGTVAGSVCLVEGNLKSPSLRGPLGTTNHYGLTDALLKEGPIRSFARRLQTDDVWFLPCGSHALDSPNFLNGEVISARFDELRKEFEYVLVDSPPLTRYPDITALGRLTDGLVLVLKASSTRKEAALEVIENLRAAQIEVLGAVLN